MTGRCTRWSPRSGGRLKALKLVNTLYSVLAAEIIQWPGSVVPLTMFDKKYI